MPKVDGENPDDGDGYEIDLKGHEVVRAITGCVPGVRMVIVHAFAWIDKATGAVHHRTGVESVLMIMSKIVDSYLVESKTRPSTASPNHEYLIQAGWEFSGRTVETETYFLTDYGHLQSSKWKFVGPGLEKETVVCTWSPEFDVEYLQDAKARLVARVRSQPMKPEEEVTGADPESTWIPRQ